MKPQGSAARPCGPWPVWRVFDRSIDPSWQPASPRAASRSEATVVPFSCAGVRAPVYVPCTGRAGVDWRVEGGMCMMMWTTIEMISLGRPYSVPNLGVGGGRGDGQASPQIGHRDARRHGELRKSGTWRKTALVACGRGAPRADAWEWSWHEESDGRFQISWAVTITISLPAPTNGFMSATHSTAGFWF